jgi:hypothetical protein
MFLSFFDKLGSIFDRRFVLAYWLPSLVFVGLFAALFVTMRGVTASLAWWDGLAASAQVVTSFILLSITVIIALLLQPLSVPLTQLYLGYWPERLASFIEWGTNREREAWSPFEVSDDRLLPSRLGNALASNYEYGAQVYQIDPAIWLARLAPLLPETFRSQMDNALTPVFCLLNLSTAFSAFAVIGGSLVVVLDQRWWLFLLVWGAGLGIAFVCYRASISQAAEYGMFIRVAFDLYRPKLIEQMRFSLPETPQQDWELWGRLTRWVHFTTNRPLRPWRDPLHPAPIHYANHPALDGIADAVNIGPQDIDNTP